jgi:ribosome-binding factor A
MDAGDEKKAALKALAHSAGYIRKQLAERINLRFTPEISFVADDSLDEGYRMAKILDTIKQAQQT